MEYRNLLPVALVSAAGIGLPPSFAQELIWDTTRHQRSAIRSTSPSYQAVAADTEIADDFLAKGAIERIVAHGTKGSPSDAVAIGVVVRFYSWTPSGPGALESETSLNVGDPGLVVDPDDPRNMDISLPTPFVADGWHYLVVQALMAQGSWSLVQSNTQLGSYVPINSPAYFRDNLAGGVWEPDSSISSPELCDIRFELYGTAIPIIESVTSTHAATPSGRLIVKGSAFGGSPSESTVRIDGLEAIVTQRFGQELRAYVPEKATIGNVAVQITTAQGTSNVETLGVTPRSPDGRIRWRFQTDRWVGPPQNMRVGPEGQIYTSDELGLYALAPDGELLWFLPGAGGGHAIDIGPDGTIYTGMILDAAQPCRLYAVHPNGGVKWIFDGPQDSAGTYYLENGPNVGPDGNIYALQNKLLPGDAGLGLFSLDPDGNLRWSDPGDPLLRNYSANENDAEILFGADRLYFGFQYGFTGAPQTSAYDLDGTQLWYTGQEHLNVLFASHPRVDPTGRVIAHRFLTGLISLEPDGSTHYSVTSPQQTSLIMPAVDAAGNAYTAREFGAGLWSVDSDGNTRWYRTDSAIGFTDSVGVAPGGTTLVASGGNFGSSDVMRGHDAATGDLRWEVALENELGTTQGVRNRYPVFSLNGAVAYHTTGFNDVEFVRHGYLYSIDIDDSGDVGTVYCDEAQNPNNVADIAISGDALSQGPIHVSVSGGPPNQFGYLLIGSANGIVQQPPGAKGDLCVVSGFLGRYDKDVVVLDSTGSGNTDIEHSSSGGPGYGIPNGGGNITAGSTWYFQYWHRQPMGAPATFSSAIGVSFH